MTIGCKEHNWPGLANFCPKCLEAHWAKTKTFDEWHAEGRRISKGAKMAGRNGAGTPVFAMRDTYVPTPRYRGGAGRDWDSDPGYSDLGIEAFQG